MNTKNIIQGLVILLLSINNLSCHKAADKQLFYILKPTSQRDDLLFMVESTNVPKIGTDSISDYLTEQEQEQHLDSNTIFKHFGRIYENNNFDLDVLLRVIDTSSRNYVFILRTFDKKRRVIDNFHFAMRIEEEDKYCYGSINQQLIIKQKCQGKKGLVKKIINKNGQFQNIKKK